MSDPLARERVADALTQRIRARFPDAEVIAGTATAGIPHAGLVMMVIVFNAVGLPLEATAMIFAVDRVLDMGRTLNNVWGDAVCAAIVARTEGTMDLTVFHGRPGAGGPQG